MLWFPYHLPLLATRGEKKENERERKKHQCVVASHMSSTGDLAHKPGMCPHWESNWWLFGSQASTQTTEPHQPGLTTSLYQREASGLASSGGNSI